MLRIIIMWSLECLLSLYSRSFTNTRARIYRRGSNSRRECVTYMVFSLAIKRCLIGLIENIDRVGDNNDVGEVGGLDFSFYGFSLTPFQ